MEMEIHPPPTSIFVMENNQLNQPPGSGGGMYWVKDEAEFKTGKIREATINGLNCY